MTTLAPRARRDFAARSASGISEPKCKVETLRGLVVVGVCVGPDRFQPAMAINKEIDLRFVLGYTPLEFRDTLHLLAEGKVDPRPLITGEVGLDGVDAAFAALGDPEAHAKILIDPRSAAAEPVPYAANA